MTEGYCARCKAKRAIINVVEETRRDGRKVVTGDCPRCGEEMFKVLAEEFSEDGCQLLHAGSPRSGVRTAGASLSRSARLG